MSECVSVCVCVCRGMNLQSFTSSGFETNRGCVKGITSYK